jgi:hypothetical protein
MLTIDSNVVLDNVLDILLTLSETPSAVIHDEAIPLLDHAWTLLTENKVTVGQFVKLIEVADRLTLENTLLIQAVELALSHEVPEIARQLIHRGQKLYPENELLQRLSNILNVPQVLEANRPPRNDLALSMEWLREHSREYAGNWIALKNGKLLGTASSRKALVAQLGGNVNTSTILITRIP